jgi:hypothetical protein
MNCMNCNDLITNKHYKCLWINKKKTNIIVCVECHMIRYFLKPWLFRKEHPEYFKNL